MGWGIIKTYTKECGCEYADYVTDVGRPFMCYTEWKTEVSKRCDKHLQKYKEHCEKEEKEREQARQIREEKRKVLKSHLVSLMDMASGGQVGGKWGA